MCGIAGAIWNDPAAAVNAETLARMTDVLAHRGPDDHGSFTSDFRLQNPYPACPGVALGHRRLSIIDVAGGRQPLSNEDESVWVTFNGEIYNYADLRHRLQGSGHRFKTNSDTETLVHLYEDEGIDFLNHLVGMFSLAIWDAAKRRLILARDRLGQKPLYYRQDGNRLLFASELKSLREVPGVDWEVDPAALDEYLTYQYVPHPNTIYRHTKKLPPGHCAIFADGQLTVRPYWQGDWNREVDSSASESIEALRSVLSESVRLRMESEVPLGAFLSGGIDSSIIAALMQQQSSAPIRTFAIGFDEADFDETPFARRVAEHLGTEHLEMRVSPEAATILSDLVWHFDEPFADSSALPTYYLAKMSREQVTVALSGDGGDELFAGYDRYRAAQLAGRIDRLAWPLPQLLGAKFWQQLPSVDRQRSLLRRWKRFSEAIAMPPQRRYAEWITIFNETRRAALYGEDFLNQLPNSDPLEFLFSAYRQSANRDFVTSTSITDLLTYLPCDLLTKVDIASMACGLECRQPFLDHRVVELAMSLPLPQKLRRGRSKEILRKAFGDLLPAEVFQRPKMGFGVPIARWFRQQLRDLASDTLFSARCQERGYFRPEAIQALWEEHQSGRFDHGYRIWSLLVLELWMCRWIDGQ